MSQADVKNCVVFRSLLFNATWPCEERDVETMAELGKDCAEFLFETLGNHPSIRETTDVEPDDWGWFFCVTIEQERYAIFVIGAMAPPPGDTWTVQVTPLGLFWRLFRRPRKRFQELLEIIDHALTTTEGISGIKWMTANEYLSFHAPNNSAGP